MDKGTLIRTVLLFLGLVNQILVLAGWSPLPFDDKDVELFLSFVFTGVISIWAWWKNNYVSKRGQKQKEVLQKHGLTTAK